MSKSSTRAISRAGPASAAAARILTRVSAMLSADRGGSPFCDSRYAAISGSSGIRLARETREYLAIELRVRLPGLSRHDSAVPNGLVGSEFTPGLFGLQPHVLVAGDALILHQP